MTAVTEPVIPDKLRGDLRTGIPRSVGTALIRERATLAKALYGQGFKPVELAQMFETTAGTIYHALGSTADGNPPVDLRPRRTAGTSKEETDMGAVPKVRHGKDDNGRACSWVQTVRPRQFELDDLVDGLASWWAHEGTHSSDDLPAMMGPLTVLEKVHAQREEWGTANIWRWHEDWHGEPGEEELREWARGIALSAFPGLEGRQA